MFAGPWSSGPDESDAPPRQEAQERHWISGTLVTNVKLQCGNLRFTVSSDNKHTSGLHEKMPQQHRLVSSANVSLLLLMLKARCASVVLTLAKPPQEQTLLSDRIDYSRNCPSLAGVSPLHTPQGETWINMTNFQLKLSKFGCKKDKRQMTHRRFPFLKSDLIGRRIWITRIPVISLADR